MFSIKPTIVAVLRKILGTAELSVEKPDLARAALNDFEKGNADFSDYAVFTNTAHIHLYI